MKPEIWTLLEQAWFQRRSAGTARSRTSVTDIESLPAPIRESLLAMYQECFGERDQPDGQNLAAFVDAVAFAEFGLDSAPLRGRKQLAERHGQIADWLGWSRNRFDELTRWWNSSSHRRRFDLTS
jgi:hypothetical protein